MKQHAKSEMTIEKLARVTQGEFLSVRKDMADGFAAVRKETADGFISVRKDMTTKDDLSVLKEEIRGETVKILRGVDAIVTRLDRKEKDDSAHLVLHQRLADTAHDHEKRIRKLEVRA